MKYEKDRANGYKKVAMQAKPEEWAKVRMVSNLESRHIHLIVNDAIREYIEKNYPNLDIEKIRNEIK
jgi:hypothetical protein